MPHIDSTKFGEIVVDGKKYHQILIIGDKVTERDYDKLKELFSTSHQIGDWEVEELLKGNPELIIIGTGIDGMLEVNQEFISQVKSQGIEIFTAYTPEAINIYNQKVSEGKRVNALIHTTC